MAPQITGSAWMNGVMQPITCIHLACTWSAHLNLARRSSAALLLVQNGQSASTSLMAASSASA